MLSCCNCLYLPVVPSKNKLKNRSLMPETGSSDVLHILLVFWKPQTECCKMYDAKITNIPHTPSFNHQSHHTKFLNIKPSSQAFKPSSQVSNQVPNYRTKFPSSQSTFTNINPSSPVSNQVSKYQTKFPSTKLSFQAFKPSREVSTQVSKHQTKFPSIKINSNEFKLSFQTLQITFLSRLHYSYR